jgi:8-oxo-dGTP pyrophosphatase MutT (NUDIX family)
MLAEIDRRANVPHQGRIACREAVRAVVLRGEQIFLIHSTVCGDYKLPGGGVQPGEDHTSALRRELSEEGGATLLKTPVEFGMTREFDFAIEPEADCFCMTSYFYRCEIDPQLGEQHLEEYEARLGFTPCWVSVADALATNQALMASGRVIDRYVKRETIVLEIILKELAG